MPLAYYLGVYLNYGIPGLFMGLGIGNTFLCALYYQLAYGEDWLFVFKRIKSKL
jgi:Na+-driven multidrug efflux pump